MSRWIEPKESIDERRERWAQEQARYLLKMIDRGGGVSGRDHTGWKGTDPRDPDAYRMLNIVLPRAQYTQASEEIFKAVTDILVAHGYLQKTEVQVENLSASIIDELGSVSYSKPKTVAIEEWGKHERDLR